MTGNQINNYRTLSDEIDNVIAKKQAEMMLNSYLANSEEMTKQRIEARTDYENTDKEYQEKKKIVEEAEKGYKKVTGRSADEITSGMSEQQIKEITKSTEEYVEGYALRLARAELEQAEIVKNQAKQRYEETSDYFGKLDDLQEAYSLGQYDRIAEIIYAEKDLTSSTLDESATSAEERLQIYSENLQKTLSDFDLAVTDMSQKSVDELGKDFTNLIQSGAVGGVDILETWEQFSDKVLKFQKNGLDISPIIRPLIESGLKPSQAFDNWQEVFRTQLANGGDMTAMIQWLNQPGYYNTMPAVFGSDEEFIKYIQEQFTQGQDVSAMLEIGANSGLAVMLYAKSESTARKK